MTIGTRNTVNLVQDWTVYKNWTVYKKSVSDLRIITFKYDVSVYVASNDKVPQKYIKVRSKINTAN